MFFYNVFLIFLFMTCIFFFLQVIGQNPLFANNPQMQTNMQQMMPNLLQQVLLIIVIRESLVGGRSFCCFLSVVLRMYTL